MMRGEAQDDADEDEDQKSGINAGDQSKIEDDKKKKGKKGKKDKRKKVIASLLEFQVMKKDTRLEFESHIKIDGLKNLKLTSLTQKILGCTVGEQVTAEAPWLEIDKELVDENLYLHHESSDFLPIKDDLSTYNDTTLLIGYDPEYIPREKEDFHRFYVAVTEKAKENLLKKLDEDRRLAEERLKNSVNKKILPWTSLGSDIEVEDSTAKNTRPLIELQLETNIDELLRPVQFRDRNVEDGKDGYLRIGPGRTEFPGVFKRRVDASVQAIPKVEPRCAQTDPGIPLNAWTQYVYDMETAKEAIERGGASELEPGFKFSEENYVEQSLEYNETFDLYTNDYPLLVLNEQDNEIPRKTLFEEYQAFTDVKHCKKMVISSLSWHPMWTGVVALAYSAGVRCLSASDGDQTVDQVIQDVYSRNPVLVWSFKDSLQPRLVLESPREIHAISWCPTDPNVLVGGCASGQIIIWDLKGKLEAVEGHEFLTPDQQKYRLAMESLVGWLKPQAAARYVRPAALSNIQLSHAGRVTEIQWVPPYYEWNDYGHLIRIPAVDGRTSMQVISSGEDGIILVWDLNRLSPDSGPGKPKKRKARKRPSALTAQISPFKAGDRKFKPIYLLYPNLPDLKIPLKLTVLSMKSIPLLYELDIPLETVRKEETADLKVEAPTEGTVDNKKLELSKRKHLSVGDKNVGAEHEEIIETEGEFLKDDPEEVEASVQSLEMMNRDSIINRETYRPVLFPPDVEAQKQLKISTNEGITMTIAWDGYDFHKGEEITTEAAKIVHYGCPVHDGPVVSCVRSPFLSDLILTVGGKVFALWVDELKDHPLFWRSNTVRVTCGSWSPFRPCMFHIGRADGSLEVWDFIARSDVPVLVQSLSGQTLTCMHEHTLPLYGGKSIMGVADYNNSFRLLFFPEEYKKARKDELNELKKFIKNEVNLKQTYYAWNEAFLKSNVEELRKIKAKEEAEEKARKEAEQAAEQEAQLRAKMEEEETKRLARSRNPMASISDRYFERLKEEREKQMQRVLMEKKRLDKTELMAKQQPILMMKQMEKEKRKKQREKIRHQQKIFDKTVAMLFPEVIEKKEEGPTRKDEFETELMLNQSVFLQEYQEMLAPQLKYIKDNPFNKRLKWDKLLAEGRERRSILDFPLYLRRNRFERYVARNEPRFKFTAGQAQPYSYQTSEGTRKKGKVDFKSDLEKSISEADIEFQGEGEEEGDELFAEEGELLNDEP